MIVYNTDTDKVENLVILGKNGNQPIIVNITYMQDTTPSNPQEKEIWYNTSNNKIYTYKNNQWKEIGEATVGVWYEYNNEYYLWDGNSLEKTDLNIYEKIENKTDNPNEISPIKYPSSKALKDGLDATFPKIVIDSGSSLPSASGYQLNDTFLNTTDKKIYKAEVNGYIQNSNIYSSGNVNVDLSTGIATGFTGTNYIGRTMPNNSKEWAGTGVSYKVHFKATSFSGWDNNKFQIIFRSQSAYQSNNYSTVIAIQNKQMYLILAYTYSSATKTGTKLFDYEILENTEYFFRITKNGTTAFAELFIGGYDGTLVASGTVETQDYLANSSSRQTYIKYGMNQEWNSSNIENFINGEVYLGDSEGELVIPNTTTLSWDSGASLTDKTEVVDKTNGILYLYENSELVKVPKPSNLSFTNISASNWVSDNTYADYAYKCDLSCSGVTANMFAQVIFAPTEADSGNYATICNTGTDIVTIYSKVNDTITIPSIVVIGV